MNEGIPVNPGIENPVNKNNSPEENFGRIKTFVQKALEEGAVDRLPSNFFPRKTKQPEETAGMVKDYFFTDATLEEIGQQHSLTRQAVKNRIDKFITGLWYVASDTLKRDSPLTEIFYRKPESQRITESKSTRRGGVSLRIKKAMQELGITHAETADLGRIALTAGVTKRQLLRTKPLLKKIWGIDIPQIQSHNFTELEKTENKNNNERLSDEAMGNLLSSVGNSEAKAITLILMRDRTILDRRSLHKRFSGTQINGADPFNYCSYSLAPAGLVAKKALSISLTTLNPSTFGYSITDKGQELGLPLAGLLLDFSERHNIPLNTLFGSSASRSQTKTVQGGEDEKIEFRKRAPSTTLQMLYEILTAPNLPIRIADIENGAVGIPTGEGHLNPHLARLAGLGLIQYISAEQNKPHSAYKIADVLAEGKLPTHEMPILTKSVFDTLKDHPNEYLTINNILALLPEEVKQRWTNTKSLRGNISRILSFLAKNKYANLEMFNSSKKSEVNITNEQRIILTELLEIMYRFQNQDQEILEKGLNLAQQIIANPQRTANLLKRAKEASPYAHRSASEETKNNILSIISAHPGITNRDIQNFLKQDYGKKLGANQLGVLSLDLSRQGIVRIEKEGNINRFYPSSNHSEER